MDYKLIEEVTGLTPLHCNVNTDCSMYYKNLVSGEIIPTSRVKETKRSLEAVFENGKLLNANEFLSIEDANGLALALGNAYKKEGKEFCLAYPVIIN
jgi:hypothetical protein